MPPDPGSTFETDGRVYAAGETLEVDPQRATELLAAYPSLVREGPTVKAVTSKTSEQDDEAKTDKPPTQSLPAAEPSGIAHTLSPKAGGKA